MFRISIADTPSRRTLLVEGALIGAWVAELGTTWRDTSQDLGTRKLVIDLTNVTAISPEGEDAIFDLMKKAVNFSSSGVLTRHVLKQLARKKQQGITTEVRHAGGDRRLELITMITRVTRILVLALFFVSVVDFSLDSARGSISW
jgi:hypothetical protein